MASICLNKDACKAGGITLGEVLLLIAIHNGEDLKRAEVALVEKGFITANRDDLFQVDGWRITRLGGQVLEEVVSESNKLMTKTKAERKKDLAQLEELAERLKAVFPEGKKPGINKYWAEGPALIVKRIEKFFEKFGRKPEWTDDAIVEAAQRYVESFNGDYTWMRTLKYFLWKDEDGGQSSDLYNVLTHPDQPINNNSWMDSVR